MFITYQIPIFDGRRFVGGSADCLVGPSWEDAEPGRHFVRHFGPVVRRRLGGHELWKDEMFYCSAHNALRFENSPDNKRIVFRRLLSNGSTIVRVQVGVRYLRRWLMSSARDFLSSQDKDLRPRRGLNFIKNDCILPIKDL